MVSLAVESHADVVFAMDRVLLRAVSVIIQPMSGLTLIINQIASS